MFLKKLRIVAAVALAVLPIAQTMPANADSVTSKVINKNLTVSEGISIDTSIYIPKSTPAPAIMIAHGFGGSKDSVKSQAEFFQKAGYVVLTWSSRGFGKSTGQIMMNSINGEVSDSKALINYLVESKYVARKADGNPLLAIMGSSYGGANALLTATQDARISAVIADITWNNLENALFPQSVIGSTELGPFKKVWAGTFFTGGALQNAYLGECGSFSAQWCSAYKNSASGKSVTVDEINLLQSVSPANYFKSFKVPLLLSQGEADSLFPLSESYKTAAEIKKLNSKADISMIWHAGGHDGGVDESKSLNQNYLIWLNHYLKGSKKDIPKFQYTNTKGSISLQDSTVIPKTFSSSSLPVDSKIQSLPISTAVTAISYPVAGVPTAISALPGLGSANSVAGRLLSNVAGFSPAFLPGQSGLLESAPLDKPLTIIGPSKIKVRITSTSRDVTLFFSLVTKSPTGAIFQPNGIVAPIKLNNIPKKGSDVTISLPAVILNAAIGDQIAVGISSTDQGYALPTESRFYSISTLSPLQFQTQITKAENRGKVAFIWPISAIIFLILSVIFIRVRRPKVGSDQIESKSFIDVVGLGKVYKDGYRAVENLSFKVERGQVMGLLGPNGAGKTTTLRMLMGLIFPSEGSIYFEGKPVYPGSAALANLGSFVEGPGFLPHLTGRENLNLYWKSIGRTGDNCLDEVVSITKLGTALDKKVRSYSQGMRQRLAIAQAMLGMPDLLVLDEPTNGLDPQQIAEMRSVLKNYAKKGRTVIISSHLLSEVEQTCTDVVLMHRGKLITSGPMKKILKSGKKSKSLEEFFLELIGDDLVIGKAVK